MTRQSTDITELVEVTPDLVITVVENATVFEGEEEVYRYDLTASGMLEGWAIQPALDQVRQMLAESWPDVEVAVDARPEVAAALVNALLAKGIGAYSAEVHRDDAVDQPSAKTEPVQDLRRWHPLHAALAVVVIATGLISWWAITREPAFDVARVAHATTEQATTSAPAPRSAAPSTSTEPPPALLEHAGLRVQLPSGYQLQTRDDGMIMATGYDPDLRIIMATEFVGDLPVEHVRAEIDRMIEEDPALTLTTPSGINRGDLETAYVEDPGDGSTVGWSVWVEQGNLYSVGCHSRTELGLSQKAACRMAAATVTVAAQA